MTTLAFYLPAAAAASVRPVLRCWQQIARTLPPRQAVEHAGKSVAALVLHHGRLRCPGVVTSEDGSRTLAIAGAYWLEPDAARLASPAEALRRVSGAGSPWLYGDYSYVMHDSATGRVVAECGGLGVVPLFYFLQGNGLGIASELKFLQPLLQHRRLCREAAAEFLVFGHLGSALTLLEGVHCIAPSTRLIVERGESRVEHAVLPPFARNETPTDATFDALDEQFERAIRRYTPDLERVAVSLSGGMDSRTTLFAARKVGLVTSPWTAGEPGSQECAVARTVAAAEGLDTRVHVNDGCRFAAWFDEAVWLSEARCPPGHMHFFDAAFAGCVEAGGHLHGLLGDVVAGGDYDVAEGVPAGAEAFRRFCDSRMQSLIYWPNGAWNRLGLDDWISARATRERVVDEVLGRCSDQDPYSRFLWSRYLHRGCGFIVPALMSQLTPWADVLTPFIDPAFFATCARIERGELLDRRMQFAWALRRYPGIAAVPRVKDGVLLPLIGAEPGVAYERAGRRLRRAMQFRYYVARLTGGRVNLRQNEGYPFYGSWYRECAAVRDYFNAMLLSPESLARGLWTKAGVTHLLRDLRVGRNVWDAVASILMLEVFARRFVDAQVVDEQCAA